MKPIAKPKILILPIIAIIALATIGITFAWYNQSFQVTGSFTTGQVWADWSFHTCGDNEVDKYIGTLDCDISSDFQTLTMTATNVYPCYEGWVWLDIHVRGTLPLIVQDIIITPPPPAELDIWVENLDYPGEPIIGMQIHPCHERGIKVHIHVLEDDAAGILPEQLTTYEFTVEFVLVQYNAYVPPP